jgi:hypothetical protein
MNRPQIMAHTIQIPIKLKFDIPKAKWTGCKATGWWMDFGRLGFVVVEPTGLFGTFDIVPFSAVPDELQKKFQGLPQELHKRLLNEEQLEDMKEQNRRDVLELNGEAPLVEVLICDLPPRGSDASEYRSIDPWRMRDEFLCLKESTRELVGFLNKHGDWDRGVHPLFRRGAFNPSIFLPDEIWREREALADALRSGPNALLTAGRNRLRVFGHRKSFPYFYHRDSTCKDALRTTLVLDFVRGLKFRTCARKDCAMPFQIESKHKRKFCTQYCAHLESVRRSRRRQARERSKGLRH